MTDSAEQRLHDAVARWVSFPNHGAVVVIDAACAALADDLDSASLRELAGASPNDSSLDIGALVWNTLTELRIPSPGTVPAGFAVAVGGGIARRPDLDSLRLEVAQASPAEFEVLVHVNGVEMTSAGAGLGMDPYDLLIPVNRLVATSEPRTVPIARCECGEYGCGSTDVTITRDGDRVHWDWSIEVPMNRGVSFATTEYDAEVARVAADLLWETAERTAGRLILTGVDREWLDSYGLRLTWASTFHRDHERFRVALDIGRDYQVFVDTAWGDRTPEQVARDVCATLALPPSEWQATWHPVQQVQAAPPAIAGTSWQREQF